MKTGDEVWIKGTGEDAIRIKLGRKVLNSYILLQNHKPIKSVLFEDLKTELQLLTLTDRLWSELPEIARLTGCWVAVDEDYQVWLSYNEIEYNAEHDGEGCWCNIDSYMLNITCPNCPDYTKQINPQGEVLTGNTPKGQI